MTTNTQWRVRRGDLSVLPTEQTRLASVDAVFVLLTWLTLFIQLCVLRRQIIHVALLYLIEQLPHW